MAKKVQKHTKCEKIPQVSKNKQKRKLTARDITKYASLQKRFYSKIKQQYFDADYIDKLSPSEKEWFSRFMEEHLNAKFNHGGKNIIKDIKKRREIYGENNARNRDTYSNVIAQGFMIDMPAETALELWQEKHLREYEETEEIRLDDLYRQESEKLTKSEYLKLKKSGAHIPEDVQAYYSRLYKL